MSGGGGGLKVNDDTRQPGGEGRGVGGEGRGRCRRNERLFLFN